MRYFPLFLDLRGQRCLVIGRGRLAGEKAAALRRAGAVVVRAPTHREGLLAGFRLAVDASGEAEVNERTWEEAERLGVLLNVVDVPSRCRFIAPAVVDRDPLLIAISTSGESPFLASALRARLERDFGSEWGPFVRLVGRVRRGLRRRGVPAAAQERTYRRLLRSEILALVRRGRTREARAVARRLARASASPERGTVALVGAGPGDAGLLTRRARELLAEADVVFHDALVEEEVLALCGPGSRLVAAGTRAGLGGRSQEDLTAALVEAAAAGADVVRLKGGDPFVFGRGGEELAGLLAAGIEVVVVPGVSSAVAAPALAGIPLTLRDVASSVAFVTMAGTGPQNLGRLAGAADTLVVLMPLGGLDEIVGVLLPRLGLECPAAVVSRATTPAQRVVRAPLGGLQAAVAAARLETPATLVVGPVVAAVRADEAGPGRFRSPGERSEASA